jgi:hypothetical protein
MIELIHCHILKTGGVTFLQMIEEVYGKDAIAFPWTWLGMAPEEGAGFKMLWSNWPKLKSLWQAKIPVAIENNPKLRVLQGHHPVGLFKGLCPEAKRICWVRHPVARVISQYQHDMKKRHQPQMPIDKYIELPHNRNLQSFYMGHYLDNMDWVGVLELIDRDIVRLAELLEWETIPKVPWLNKSEKVDFSGIGKKIADLNMQDMNLYAEVISRKPGVQRYG